MQQCKNFQECVNLETNKKPSLKYYIRLELCKQSQLASFAADQSTAGTAMLTKLQRQCTSLCLSHFSWFPEPP